MTKEERYELAMRQALGRLRHMYQQMVNGLVRPDQAAIANGILSPVIMVLEELADSMARDPDPGMDKSEFTLE